MAGRSVGPEQIRAVFLRHNRHNVTARTFSLLSALRGCDGACDGRVIPSTTVTPTVAAFSLVRGLP